MRDRYFSYYLYILRDSTFREDTQNDTYYRVDITNYARELLFYDTSERF